MNREQTYKAPVKVCYCHRCRTATPSKYIDYPEEYERDKVCAVCGAVKATESMDSEPLTLGWKIWGSVILLSLVSMFVSVFVIGSLPAMVISGLVGVVVIAGALIVTHIPERWRR